MGDSIIKAKLASFSTLRLPCMPARDIEVRLWGLGSLCGALHTVHVMP